MSTPTPVPVANIRPRLIMSVRIRQSERGDAVIGLIVTLIALMILGLGAMLAFGIVSAYHVEHQTCTVQSKDRAEGDMRLYTEDCGVLSVGDSIIEGHYRSGDTYASIEPGNTYEFKTRGYRVPFLSMFPSVVKANEVAR